MSYDPRLLFEEIAESLQKNPRKTLEELSQCLRVSKRTIKKTVRLTTGGNFRSYREGVLMDRVKGFFAVQPEVAIKVLSIDLGFKSPSSFARAVRRASGSCPGELRTAVAGNCQERKSTRHFIEFGLERTGSKPGEMGLA